MMKKEVKELLIIPSTVGIIQAACIGHPDKE